MPSDATVGESSPTQGSAFSTTAPSSALTVSANGTAEHCTLDGVTEVQGQASSTALALLQRAGSSGWSLGFTPQVREAKHRAPCGTTRGPMLPQTSKVEDDDDCLHIGAWIRCCPCSKPS
eukprot:scaffold35343_cov17-Tisochrysis_lutea.AAC.1